MTKKLRAAVVLSGCGAMDGAEISESVIALYALSCKNIDYQVFAPNQDQHHVIDHLSGEVTGEQRNIMKESARISRGDVQDLLNLNMADYDMLVLPGGFGGAKNLSSYAFEGKDMSIIPSLENVITQAHKAQKPIGAMCIMPVIVAKALSKTGVVVCTGEDEGSAELVAKEWGATVENTAADQATVDHKNKVSTTPAFMYSNNTLSNIGSGATKMIDYLVEMI